MKIAIKLAALIALSTSLSAQTFLANLSKVDQMKTVQGHVNGPTANHLTGVIDFSEFQAFCVEPSQSIMIGQSVEYTVASLANLPKAYEISQVVGGYLTSSRDADHTAAVQWAIWELVSDTGYSLSSGGVSITGNSTVLDLANTYLGSIGTFNSAPITYLINRENQDMVSWNCVPEPSSALLGVVGSLALLRRRR